MSEQGGVLEAVREFTRVANRALDQAGNNMARRINEFILRLHSPTNVGPDNEPRLVCLQHRRAEDWPCSDAAAAFERQAELARK